MEDRVLEVYSIPDLGELRSARDLGINETLSALCLIDADLFCFRVIILICDHHSMLMIRRFTILDDVSIEAVVCDSTIRTRSGCLYVSPRAYYQDKEKLVISGFQSDAKCLQVLITFFSFRHLRILDAIAISFCFPFFIFGQFGMRIYDLNASFCRR